MVLYVYMENELNNIRDIIYDEIADFIRVDLGLSAEYVNHGLSAGYGYMNCDIPYTHLTISIDVNLSLCKIGVCINDVSNMKISIGDPNAIQKVKDEVSSLVIKYVGREVSNTKQKILRMESMTKRIEAVSRDSKPLTSK